MILLAVFGTIALGIALSFFVLTLIEEKKLPVALLILVLVFAIAASCGAYFHIYGVNQLKEVVLEYNTYRIVVGTRKIEFSNPVRIRQTISRYPKYTLYVERSLYEVLGPATE